MSGDEQVEIKLAKDSLGYLHLIYISELTPSPLFTRETLEYTRSTDNGETWSVPITITTFGGRTGRGSIRVDNNDIVHIVYQEKYGIYYQKHFHVSSYDHGATWSEPHFIHDGGVTAPNFAIDSSNYLYMVYAKAWDGNLYFRKSVNGGINWSEETIVIPTPQGFNYTVQNWIEIDSNDAIHVLSSAYYFSFGARQAIFYAKSNNGGDTWTPAKMVSIDPSSTTNHARFSHIVIDNNNILHLMYYYSGDEKTHYLKSVDGGETFGDEILFSQRGVYLTSDSNNTLYVYYVENNDLFVRTSEDQGQSFSLPQNLTQSNTVAGTGMLLPNNDDPGFIPIWVDTQPEVYTIRIGKTFYPLLEVAIDIKPGSFPNSINLGSGGTVPVAIFSTIDFDATWVDPTTVTLASAPVKLKGKGTPMASSEDVDGDGLFDLIVHVSTEAFQLSETDTEATVEGQTFDGTLIKGVDSIRVVP